MPYKNASECWKEIMSDVRKNAGLLSEIQKFAKENTEPTNVVFGTSGWRGEIGFDYTYNNFKIVTTAIIEMFKEEAPEVMKALGVKDFNEVKTRGVIVGHDNRFLGPDFAKIAIGLLNKEGIKTYYSGETTTPEFSTAIEELGAACSINLTPSHNPAQWAGFKFNPSDGGPAGSEITKVIEKFANSMMAQKRIIPDPDTTATFETIDPIALYEKFINKRGTLNTQELKKFIEENDCLICIDHVHGSTRTRPQRLLGESPKIKYFRTGDDYLFGGIAPEPSSENMKKVTEALRSSSAKFKLGVIMDPDGDRIRFTDGTTELPMNYFGALAFHFFYKYKGFKGIVTKSVATSNFVNAIAEKLCACLRETMVGFKNFRPYLLPTASECAIIAFEESDGITGFNHTLEKDSIFGFLVALEMMAKTGKNIGDYFKDVQEECGYFYPDRAGIVVDRSLVGKPLAEKLSKIRETMQLGTKVTFGDSIKTIKDVITVDGTKIVFDDDSWLLIRPSGTEPKVRFYIETRSEAEKDIMFKKAEEITKNAIAS
ncbi:MAG: phosphomannomutase [Nitrospirae bacterium]|nr:phosphomannomutase [Nitrospirota bacterium]MBF0534564.1 phosphomannomutase [Nitrospirota bacterium]MBF0617599.1 phosphomannomutase [Nitrospirota bacterium]